MTLSAQVDALRRDLTAAQQENNDLKRERNQAQTWNGPGLRGLTKLYTGDLVVMTVRISPLITGVAVGVRVAPHLRSAMAFNV
jgi:hypothetical protein